MAHLKREAEFEGKLEEVYPFLEDFKHYDLVIGIPFGVKDSNLLDLVKDVDRLLSKWMGRRYLIVLVGDSEAEEVLSVIRQLKLSHPHLGWTLPDRVRGRGMKVRALIEICKFIDADLLLLSPDMAVSREQTGERLWLDRFVLPIQNDYDMVIGGFKEDVVRYLSEVLLVSPVLEVFYGSSFINPVGGVYAISHDFVEELAHEARFWGESIAGEGIDFWLITRALCWNKNVCEVSLKAAPLASGLLYGRETIKELGKTLFTAIKRDSAVWLKDRLVIKKADTGAAANEGEKTAFFSSERLFQMREEFIREYSEQKENLGSPSFTYPAEVRRLLQYGEEINEAEWVFLLTELMLLYSFENENLHDEILRIFYVFYTAWAANCLKKWLGEGELRVLAKEERNDFLAYRGRGLERKIAEEFRKVKPDFSRRWLALKEQHKPPIVPLGYMEYVPNKPIVVPKKIAGKDEEIVNTDEIFRYLRKVYEDRFERFVTEGLGLASGSPPREIINAVESFMTRLEDLLAEIFPGELDTDTGLELFINWIMDFFPQQMFTINDELLREMIMRFPPLNLMIPLGFYKPQDLIENMDVRNAVTYANLIESWSYTDRDLLWLVDNLRPESFGETPVKPLVLKDEIVQGGGLSGHKISYLNRITARIAVRKMPEARGGKYPRLRYWTSILRRLALAESYGELFRLTVMQRKNIGEKIKNSLLSLAKGEDFSAYNIFENQQHRILVSRIRRLACEFKEKGDQGKARLFELMADGYGLSQVLEDGTFLSCTAWSWASYSFKGGLKIPTPFTTSVESRWFNHDFLECLYRNLGYDPREIMEFVFKLIQEGRSSHNLLDTLLPTRPKDVTVVVQEITNEPSKYLKRCAQNPILEPVKEHKWESKYVLNPGALRIKDKVYLFYRAVGEDNISHIGLAITDGYRVLERLPKPIFSPAIPEEKMGCEDPRVVVIGDKIFMLYTAYDGNIAQVAAASIKLDDFIKGRYTAWKREGLAFTNIWDKDAIIWPEKINGKYVIYHRIEPSIWVTYTDKLKFPIKEKHAIIVGPRPGRMWDSLKIGAGAQPLKTKYGWLLIYHGVDYNYIYRLGVLLVDRDNPQKVIYRSLNPILEPEKDYEVGLSGAWVPNVVFTCGAVPAEDKKILEDDDEILVYYGAADTSIGMASAKLSDLIPKVFRKRRV
ncbi:glycosidase [Thermosyntropha sp.]|uniref:glycoside hydrolase family 130 protein n=1 Tax=Thermosyntropha sp. TaxID=2740820 RepID=UPI0025E5705E|nr:glycosidase [Thermosyntropha sp.]MBO8159906.1 glycosidase [Thermosyntropha sp.]